MTTENAVVATDTNAELIERVVMMGDLSKLTADQRVSYYRAVCESAGLNPLTQPFAYLTLNNKLILYAGKNASEQIRQLRGISVTKLEREQTDSTYDVTAYGLDKSGRTDAALGSVSIAGLRGEALANAKMKAETKAKRRLTLSIAGLGFLDETEVGSIPGAERVNVDMATGEIVIPQTKVQTLRELAEAAAEAAEGSQDAPQGEEAVQTDADTAPLFPDAPAASVAPVGLTEREFAGLVKTAGTDRALVSSTAKRIFPDARSSADLTDEQREMLWDVIAIEAQEREA